MARAEGSNLVAGELTGFEPGTVSSWRQGRRTPGARSRARLQAALEGDCPEAREQRLKLYERRAAGGLGIFDGLEPEDRSGEEALRELAGYQ